MSLRFYRLASLVCLVTILESLGMLAVPVWCQARQEKTALSLPARFEEPYNGFVQGMTFTGMVTMLQRGAHVSIIADGAPLLKQADFEFKGTLHQALDKVADKFDFRWTLSRSGVVLMSKRFTNTAEDQPQISLAESRQIVADMIKALRTTAYDSDPGSWQQKLQQLAQTLSSAQLQAMRSEAKLSASQLLPGQLDTLSQAILSNAFGEPLQIWQDLNDYLELLPNSYLLTKIRGGDPVNLNVPSYYDVMEVLRAKNGSLHPRTFMGVPVPAKEGRKP